MRRLIMRRRWAWLGVAALSIALVPLAVHVADAGVGTDEARVSWQTCRTYSDDAIRGQGITDAQIPAYRALLKRMECGTVSVPLDYRRPGGKQVTIAVTRLRATDTAKRLGILAMNPGGPGASGYLMPLKVTMFNDQSARLNERYDLIGFDPRGVNYSTVADCDVRFAVAPGVTDKAAGKTAYDEQVTANQQCRQTDPTFMAQLSALTVARDLDRIRTALGERTLSYIGVSWGTYLGVVYRTAFPRHVDRMFLDSVVNLQDGTATLETEGAAAAERDFSRLAAWIAQHDGTYHLGATTEKVRATVLDEVRSYQANPRQFTDMPPFDGAQIANLASQTQSSWPQVAAALAALLDAPGPAAPPAVQAIFSGQQTPPAPDAPENGNSTTTHVTACNDDPSRLDFAAAWSAYQQRLTQNSVTGLRNMFPPECPGWPAPQQAALRSTGGSLVLAGHRYENVTPYEWAVRMQNRVGGKLFTVNDDEHGSALKNAGCAAKLVAYFNTGRIDHGCDGVPTP